MTKHRGVRRRVAGATAVAAFAILGALPATSSADPVSDLLKGINLDQVLGGGSGAGTGGSSDSGPGSGGGKPHATGTVAAIDVNPGTSEGDFLHGEEVVVGRSHAEQNDQKQYKGKVTILSLLGQDLLAVSTSEGETRFSPLHPLQTNLLDAICTGSDSALCVGLLIANSSSDGSGSANNFGLLTADSKLGDKSISAGVAESSGSLKEEGSCQTATASSGLARADVFDVLAVRVLQSFAQSVACIGEAGVQNNDSTLLSINGNGLPLPGGCENGVVNGGFGILSLVTISCSSDSSSGSEGSRGTVTAEAVGDNPPLAQVDAPNASSGSVAPSGDGGGGNPPSGDGGNAGDEGGNAGAEGGSQGAGAGSDGGPGSVSASAQPSGGELAFTGSDLLVLALAGLGLIGAGLAFAGLRRRIDATS